MRRKAKWPLHVAKLLLLFPLFLYVIFIGLEKYGYVDRMQGLDLAQQVAERFEKSVGPDDAVPVRVGDREFEPTLALINKYSAVKLDPNKRPTVIARMQANVYDAQPITPDGKLSQWTSPATPIAVMYYEWPHQIFPGGKIPADQVAIVGTLGNLHEWIARKHEDTHFWVVDLMLVGLLPVMVGLYEYIVEKRYEEK